MDWSPKRPYNELPLLPPQADLETRRVLKSVVAARSALAALDQATRLLPNPSVLINSIPLLEAQASSEIENIVTTADDLFRHAADDDATLDPAVKETLQYRRALYAGVELVDRRPLTATVATQVCTVVKMREMTLRSGGGTFIGNPVTMRPVYTPPVGEATIRRLLENWESFVHSASEIDPLVVMAAAHYQFEAIHPFDDGNGRTGRILNILLLVERGLLSQPVLYLSRYIIRHKKEYYDLLLGVTARAEWEAWLLYVLEGIRQTALATLRKIDAIHALEESVRAAMRSATTAGANADLLAVLFEQPYCRIGTVTAACGVSRPTATAWLAGLVEAGVLRSVYAGRDRLFINTALVEVLTRETEFDELDAEAARAGQLRRVSRRA